MRVRNKWFTLILWSLIFMITFSLILKINQGVYPIPMQEEVTLNKIVVEVDFDDGFEEFNNI